MARFHVSPQVRARYCETLYRAIHTEIWTDSSSNNTKENIAWKFSATDADKFNINMQVRNSRISNKVKVPTAFIYLFARRVRGSCVGTCYTFIVLEWILSTEWKSCAHASIEFRMNETMQFLDFVVNFETFGLRLNLKAGGRERGGCVVVYAIAFI